jgi:hypothetical protein
MCLSCPSARTPPRKNGVVQLHIQESRPPVLECLHCQCTKVIQPPFAAPRLGIANSDDPLDEIDLSPTEQAQFLGTQPVWMLVSTAGYRPRLARWPCRRQASGKLHRHSVRGRCQLAPSASSHLRPRWPRDAPFAAPASAGSLQCWLCDSRRLLSASSVGSEIFSPRISLRSSFPKCGSR